MIQTKEIIKEAERGLIGSALQARVYAALVGGSDFLRTQAGPAEVCRLAYRRSEIAVEVWRKERAKAMEARDER